MDRRNKRKPRLLFEKGKLFLSFPKRLKNETHKADYLKEPLKIGFFNKDEIFVIIKRVKDSNDTY